MIKIENTYRYKTKYNIKIVSSLLNKLFYLLACCIRVSKGNVKFNIKNCKTQILIYEGNEFKGKARLNLRKKQNKK